MSTSRTIWNFSIRIAGDPFPESFGGLAYRALNGLSFHINYDFEYG